MTAGLPEGTRRGSVREASLPGAVPLAARLPWQYRAAALAARWEYLALGAILVLSAYLNFYLLNTEGYANTYYSAAVKSMLTNWHNFFFVSFDPGGFVAVDKPPLGLWIQAAGVKLFGFHGVFMLAPQALAGVLSVALLYALVARFFGRGAGLLAALALALTPIAVVDNRNNTADSLLVLALLAAAWCAMRAVETGRLRWVVWMSMGIGLGFNIKEMEAYLILPAAVLVYLVAAPRPFSVRIWHLLLAGVVTLVVSFAWIVAVDLTPAAGRPFVSDSGTNSELSLALGYNGLGRLATGLLSQVPAIPFLQVRIDGSIVPGISVDIGNPGPFRLFDPAVGGQASWLLPLALAGLVAAFLRSRPRFPLGRREAALLFWAAWLLSAALFFSVARFYHLYYLIMLAPAVAALAGIGIVSLWREYRNSMVSPRERIWQGWLLPVSLLVTAAVQARIVGGYGSWNGWLGPAIVVGTVILAALLVMGRLGLRILFAPDVLFHVNGRGAMAAAVGGVILLLSAPTAFATGSIGDGNGAAWLPQAGPALFGFGGGPGGGPVSGRFAPPGQFGGRSFTPPRSFSSASSSFGGGAAGAFPLRRGAFRGFGGGGGFGGSALTFAGSQTPRIDGKLLHYLEAQQRSTRYLVATAQSNWASLFILDTGKPVMALGGYQGWDKILTTSQLAQSVRNDIIRFFLVPASGGGTPAPTGGSRQPGSFGGPSGAVRMPASVAGLNSANDGLFSWVRSHCTAVQARTYGGISTAGSSAGRPSFGAESPGQLYDCAPARSS